MSYAIKYYRDDKAEKWWRERGIVNKTAGWIIGRSRHERRSSAQTEADHLNKRGVRAEVVHLNIESLRTKAIGNGIHN